MKPTRTWIVIVDSGRGRVLENLGPGKGATRVEALDWEASLPATHDIVADRQGRSFESSTTARHPMEPRTDPRQQLKRSHLETIAERLDAHLEAGAYDRLVVVAPPQALGILRAALSDRVKARVHGEVAKDLTKTPDQDLASHLADVIRL